VNGVSAPWVRLPEAVEPCHIYGWAALALDFLINLPINLRVERCIKLRHDRLADVTRHADLLPVATLYHTPPLDPLVSPTSPELPAPARARDSGAGVSPLAAAP